MKKKNKNLRPVNNMKKLEDNSQKDGANVQLFGTTRYNNYYLSLASFSRGKLKIKTRMDDNRDLFVYFVQSENCIVSLRHVLSFYRVKVYF
jgi:hypothetical protein